MDQQLKNKNQKVQVSIELQKQKVQSQIIQIRPEIENGEQENNINNINLYKIFGQETFSFEAAYGKSITDWSAFYTQLTPQHSMRYLTKKWNDGADYACLLKLKIRKDAKKICRLIKVSHPLLSKYSVPGQVKANLIKNHIRQVYNINFLNYETEQQKPLMKTLGQNGVLLQCVDSQQQQIIIPHNLLNKDNFQYQGLAIFKKSNDGLLRTISWKEYQQNLIQQNVDYTKWYKINGNEQFDPYLLLQTNLQFKKHIDTLIL